MTLIGKIFTVLILIMSVVFMSVAMMVYATHTNWREVAKGDGAGNQGLEGTIAELQTQEKALKEEIDILKKKLAEERAARTAALAAGYSRNDVQDQEIKALSDANADLVKTKQDLLTQLKVSQDDAKQLQLALNQLRQDIKTAEASRDTSFEEVIALTDKVQQYKVEQERLNERSAQLAQQVARMNKVLAANGMNEYTPVNNVPPPLNAVVTAVSDRDLVEISVGADDGIHEGNTLDVYRGDTYLGRIIIKQTQPDRAVGEIIKDFRRGVIKKGDNVSTKLG